MPGNQIDLSLPSHYVRYQTGTATGSWSFPTPLDFTALLKGFRITILTDASVQNRVFGLELDQGGRVGMQFCADYTQTASQQITYIGGVGIPEKGPYGTLNYCFVAIPERFIVRPGDLLQLGGMNMRAGDQTLIREFAFEEWMTD